MGRSAKAALVWKRRIEEQRHSGLPVALFCEQQGFSAPSFYVWRKRLSGKGPAQRPARPVSSASGRAGVVGYGHGVSSLFVPVRVSSADCQGVRIELPGGAVVSLPGDAPVELVAAAIRAACVRAAGERSSC